MKGKISSGPVTRTRAMQRAYMKYLKERTQKTCIFCSVPEEQPKTIIEDNSHTLVIKNRFGYAIWEGCKVLDQLMVIPKKHRNSLSDFTKREKEEWIDVCAKYELAGYSLYTRSPDNITKSIAHHHTHFIKLGKKRKSYIVYLRKPHILMTDRG